MNTTSNTAAGHEILVFALGAEAYGIDILKVQEIRGYEKVTQVANAPDHIKGVVNLRGAIVPIVDMRILLNLGRADYDAQTVVIILNLGSRVVGMVVDSVSDVQSLTADQISPAPQMGGSMATQYLAGIGSIEDHMIILMDIEKLMQAEGFVVDERLAA